MITSSFISKNLWQSQMTDYVHTAMVSHRGTPVSFAMRNDGKIFYSILDLSKTPQNASKTVEDGEDQENDKHYWSKVKFEGKNSDMSTLQFPKEITQVGYGVVANRRIGNYCKKGDNIVSTADDTEINPFYSTTARLGAVAPFQALSDGKYIYIFRQSVLASDAENIKNGDISIVNSTLLVDRFILSGTTLKLSREIRYQRSRHKTEPASRKDTLSAVDIEGRPFYEPTRELAFVKNLSKEVTLDRTNVKTKILGDFTVLLLPSADSEEQRWQIFAYDTVAEKINSFNIRFDYSIVFDTTDSEDLVQAFLEQYKDKYNLEESFAADVQAKMAENTINQTNQVDENIATEYYEDQAVEDLEYRDALGEVIYTIREGVSKDDFILVSASEWPLMEYTDESKEFIKEEYLENGSLKEEYQFVGNPPRLLPYNIPYYVRNGLSACYYYQQEIMEDNQSMKTQACVMLAMGLEDKNQNKYIGILNFSVGASGRLSRLTTDSVNIPDINMQALDENPYKDLSALNKISWQESKVMNLIDIDNNGLSTSGGVLKFAYTSADQAVSEGYSDAAEATFPQVFDDSLGRVNLYFKGKNDNFFVMYFNPTGSKSITITDNKNEEIISSPLPLSLKPRLSQEIDIQVIASATTSDNICILTMNSEGQRIEEWKYLPKRIAQIADILNGKGELKLATLDALKDANDPKAAYLKPSRENTTSSVIFRTTTSNNLMFNTPIAFADKIKDGVEHSVALSQLSVYLSHNPNLIIAEKSFEIKTDENVSVKAAVFYKSYLSGLVNTTNDIDKLWSYLTDTSNIISKNTQNTTTNSEVKGYLGADALTKTRTNLKALINDDDIDKLNLDLLSIGNPADIKNRLTVLKQRLVSLLLDIAKIRLVRVYIRDTNDQKVDRLGAGLVVNVAYNYGNFECTPANIRQISADKWEYARSYLFNAKVTFDANTNAFTEIADDLDYTYEINNTIGQWEDWEASLALEFRPSLASGALLTTADTSKLQQLSPTEKGLSVEAWIKPETILDKEKPNIILFYKNGNQHYSLGIEEDGDDANQYKCVATLGTNKYKTKNAYNLSSLKWKHVAFTHRKYWGYRLENGNTINCGSDDSLHLNDEFTIEVLVQINSAGTLLEKEGEYRLSVGGDGVISFRDGNGTNYLNESGRKPSALSLGEFYKISLIRSKQKPKANPTEAEYPITGAYSNANQADTTNKKWYEDKESNEIIKGMAEKQDQMERKMDFAQTNMFGNGNTNISTEMESNPKYWYTLVIIDTEESLYELWQTSEQKKARSYQSYQNFTIGGDGFNGVVDSVRIWTRALSKGDAQLLDLSENKTGLISNWRMTEGRGRYLYDNIGENHGVASGGTWDDSPRTGQAGQFLFYIDGQFEPHETTTLANTTQGNRNQFSIGGYKASDSNTHQHFKGTLEEIRIWNLPRTNEQITDNTFGRLKGEWDQLLANYTFDTQIEENEAGAKIVLDSSPTTATLTLESNHSSYYREVLSTAPVATEIPQIRSALTGVLTNYNGTLRSRSQVVEYGDIQKNDDGTINGILKRCYSFIDAEGKWNRMTGYKVGNLVSQWYGQAQFAPQVMGYLEGPPPVPRENFPVDIDADLSGNAITFNQAEEVSYNYSTSKEAGWNATAESEAAAGLNLSYVIAPFGFGIEQGAEVGGKVSTYWEGSGSRSESYERGVAVSTSRALSATMAGYNDDSSDDKDYYELGNTGYALVKSKTADIFLLRLAHNNALVSISWRPNPDIPEDVNILPFPINPLYTKQGTLDGKLGETTDNHYPQAHGAYGEYSYFKPREAYKLKKQIERERQELNEYYQQFVVANTNGKMTAALASTGAVQLANLIVGYGPIINSAINQGLGRIATHQTYSDSKIQDEIAGKMSMNNLVNTYVWTMEGGFYAESTEVSASQQETFSSDISLSLGGASGITYAMEGGVGLEQEALFGSGSSLILTKSRTKEASNSFGLEIDVDIPTSPRYKYAGIDGHSLVNRAIPPGTVDAYRFMSFYLEPKSKNFIDLFTKVVDPIWLAQSPDPNAQAMRQARGNVDKAKPCWRIMHRVTYVSRILPEFTPEAPPSLEKTIRVAGFESNYALIKRFEPYLRNSETATEFFNTIDRVINTQFPEFAVENEVVEADEPYSEKSYKQQIKEYLALYFNMDMV